MASQLMRTTRLTSSALPSTSTQRIAAFSTTARALKKPTPPTSAASSGTAGASTASADKPRRVLTFANKSGTSNFKTYLPVTPSLRQLRQPISEHLHKGGPHRPLTIAKRSSGGRNDHGRITVRARGGGHKRRIRLVDFHRREAGEQEVVRIEYDPGRSAHIALIKHKQTGDLSYILAPETLREGDTVQSFRAGIPDSFTVDSATTGSSTDPASPQSVLPPASSPSLPGLGSSSSAAAAANEAPTPSSTTAGRTALAQIDLGTLRSVAIRPGNCLPLRLIPVGTLIHAITLSPEGPAIMARSAGHAARIISASSPTGKHAQVRLSSGEVRLIGLECVASIGTVSNPDHQHRNLGKAGRMRWLGFRPQSRGVAMNATDHPHGGGRGKSKSGKHPVSFSNVGAKGTRTRPPKSKNGNKFVVKERPRGTDKSKR